MGLIGNISMLLSVLTLLLLAWFTPKFLGPSDCFESHYVKSIVVVEGLGDSPMACGWKSRLNPRNISAQIKPLIEKVGVLSRFLKSFNFSRKNAKNLNIVIVKENPFATFKSKNTIVLGLVAAENDGLEKKVLSLWTPDPVLADLLFMIYKNSFRQKDYYLGHVQNWKNLGVSDIVGGSSRVWQMFFASILFEYYSNTHPLKKKVILDKIAAGNSFNGDLLRTVENFVEKLTGSKNLTDIEELGGFTAKKLISLLDGSRVSEVQFHSKRLKFSSKKYLVVVSDSAPLLGEYYRPGVFVNSKYQLIDINGNVTKHALDKVSRNWILLTNIDQIKASHLPLFDKFKAVYWIQSSFDDLSWDRLDSLGIDSYIPFDTSLLFSRLHIPSLNFVAIQNPNLKLTFDSSQWKDLFKWQGPKWQEARLTIKPKAEIDGILSFRASVSP